ncbi:MAG: hypothetical protein UFX72_09755, partial [Adlercreutzia sp.]|nr:hypothetical protein [Adlercreutzia sp.]
GRLRETAHLINPRKVLDLLNIHSPSSCHAAPTGQRSPTSLPPQQSNTMEGPHEDGPSIDASSLKLNILNSMRATTF